MEVHDSLTSGYSVIDTDVEGVGSVLNPEFVSHLVEHRQQRKSLSLRHVEEGGNMALGYDEAVPGRHRKAVEYPQRVVVLGPNAFSRKGAEHAVACHAHDTIFRNDAR